MEIIRPELVALLTTEVPIRKFDSEDGIDPNYETVAPLGKGSYGTVAKVRRKSDGKILACKSIKLKDSRTAFLVNRELSLLSAISGYRNVVQWYNDTSVNCRDGTVHMHMEYYPEGDLWEVMKNKEDSGDRFSEEYIVSILADMTAALSDCHAQGIIHRDIKPPNILLKTEWVWRYESDGTICDELREGTQVNRLETRAYLCDFGTAKPGAVMSGGHKGSMLCGTTFYMAPESLNPFTSLYGEKSDIFSLGCVAYELCELKFAYNSVSRAAVPPMEAPYSETLRKLVGDCMALCPMKRVGTASLTTRVQGLQRHLHQQRQRERELESKDG